MQYKRGGEESCNHNAGEFELRSRRSDGVFHNELHGGNVLVAEYARDEVDTIDVGQIFQFLSVDADDHVTHLQLAVDVGTPFRLPEEKNSYH